MATTEWKRGKKGRNNKIQLVIQTNQIHIMKLNTLLNPFQQRQNKVI